MANTAAYVTAEDIDNILDEIEQSTGKTSAVNQKDIAANLYCCTNTHPSTTVTRSSERSAYHQTQVGMACEATNGLDTSDPYDPDSNVYVANLPSYLLYSDYNKQQLYKLFRCYGPIERYKFVAPGKSFQRGYGFVQFTNRKDAYCAIKSLEGYTFTTGETISVSIALRRSMATEQTNLYVKNIPNSWTNVELRKVFGAYGRIRQSRVMVGDDGIAFVSYENRAQAVNAIIHLDGRMADDVRKLKVRFATRKTAVNTDTLTPIPSGNKNNLYVFNLPKYYNYASLDRLFAHYGMVSCAKFNTNGTAFVRFIHSHDAARAARELNGKKLRPFDKPIGVELARYDIGDTKCNGNTKCNSSGSTSIPSATVSDQDANVTSDADDEEPMNNEIQLALQSIQQQLNQLII